MRSWHIALASLLTLFVVHPEAFAAFDVPLIPNNQWVEFTWDAGGVVTLPIETDDVFGLTSPPSFIHLEVTDVGFSGDQFKLFLNNIDIGNTSFPTADGEFIGFEANKAFDDPTWSSGSFDLGPLTPGTHEIKIEVIRIPLNQPDGIGAVRARQLDGIAIPEPHAAIVWSILLAGLSPIACLKRRFAGLIV